MEPLDVRLKLSARADAELVRRIRDGAKRTRRTVQQEIAFMLEQAYGLTKKERRIGTE